MSNSIIDKKVEQFIHTLRPIIQKSFPMHAGQFIVSQAWEVTAPLDEALGHEPHAGHIIDLRIAVYMKDRECCVMHSAGIGEPEPDEEHRHPGFN